MTRWIIAAALLGAVCFEAGRFTGQAQTMKGVMAALANSDTAAEGALLRCWNGEGR